MVPRQVLHTGGRPTDLSWLIKFAVSHFRSETLLGGRLTGFARCGHATDTRLGLVACWSEEDIGKLWETRPKKLPSETVCVRIMGSLYALGVSCLDSVCVNKLRSLQRLLAQGRRRFTAGLGSLGQLVGKGERVHPILSRNYVFVVSRGRARSVIGMLEAALCMLCGTGTS
ncbi:hypothetical protein J6590_052846 [Homalodisca vitripennis]|nr:hypothetical protein J6590_052846 [Homalodisca vitripennis]